MRIAGIALVSEGNMQGKDPEAKTHCVPQGPKENLQELRGAEGVQIPKGPPRPWQEESFYSKCGGEPSLDLI